MKEQEKRYLVVVDYRSSGKGKSLKPIWQVIDTCDRCAVVADNFKLKEDAIKRLEEIEEQESLVSLTQV